MEGDASALVEDGSTKA